jgi:hypothetical protein
MEQLTSLEGHYRVINQLSFCISNYFNNKQAYLEDIHNRRMDIPLIHVALSQFLDGHQLIEPGMFEFRMALTDGRREKKVDPKIDVEVVKKVSPKSTIPWTPELRESKKEVKPRPSKEYYEEMAYAAMKPWMYEDLSQSGYEDLLMGSESQNEDWEDVQKWKSNHSNAH